MDFSLGYSLIEMKFNWIIFKKGNYMSMYGKESRHRFKLGVAVLIMAVIWALGVSEQVLASGKKAHTTKSVSVKASTLNDGSYEGQGAGFDASSVGNIIVRTEIANKKIKGIEVLAHRELNSEEQIRNFEKTKSLITNSILSTQNPKISEAEIKEIIKDLIKDMQPIPKNQCIQDGKGIAQAVSNSLTASPDGTNQIYFNPDKGSDGNNGKDAAHGVKTIERAKSLLSGNGKIVLVAKWRIKKGEEVSLKSDKDSPLVLERQPGMIKDMIEVQGELHIENFIIDGHKETKSKGNIISLSTFENSKGVLTLNKGAILQNNVAIESGGAIYVGENASVKIDGGVIKNNVTYGRGGGICTESTVEFISGEITGNTAFNGGTNDAGSGGGVVNIGSFGKGLIMKGGKIHKNHAQRRGGGIAGSYQIFKMEGGSIENNTSEEGSGGISDVGHYWNKTLILKGGSIKNNAGDAPGIDLADKNTMLIKGDITIKDNKSKNKISNIKSKNTKIIGELTGEINFATDDGMIEGGSEDAEGQVYKITSKDVKHIFNDDGLMALLQDSGNRVLFVPSADDGIKVNPNLIRIREGEKTSLNATSIPSVSEDSFRWKSDDDKIAEVDQQGNVIGKKIGSTFVRVTNKAGKTAICRVIVLVKELPSNLKDGVYTGSSRQEFSGKPIKVRVFVKGNRINDIKIVKHNENLMELGFANTYIDGILQYYTLERPYISGHEAICEKVQSAISEALKTEPYDIKDLDEVYLDPKNGDDTAFGFSPKEAVKTYEQAIALTGKKKNVTLWLMGSLTIDKYTTIGEKNSDRKIVLKRHDGLKSPMIIINGGGLTLRNITLDGNMEKAGLCMPMIFIPNSSNKRDFALKIREGAVLKNNSSNENSVIHNNHRLASVYMQSGEIKNNKSKGALINIQRGDMYFTGGKVHKNIAPAGLLKKNNNNLSVHVGGKAVIETAIKIRRLGVNSPLASGSRISIYNPSCKLVGSKRDIYASKKYKIKRTDLKHIKHIDMLSKLNKKGEVYFVVKAPKVKKNLKKGKVILKWRNVPFAKKYKILRNGKKYKIIKAKGKFIKAVIKAKRGKKLKITIITQGSNGFYGETVKLRTKVK